jgi:hypothetical protein
MGQTWRAVMLPSCLFGVAVGGGLLYWKYSSNELSSAGVDDRAYRIVHNASQNKVDKYSAIGAAAGGVVGALTGAGIAPMIATGVAFGPIYFAAEKQFGLNKYYPKEAPVDLDGIKAQIDKLFGKK